MKTTAIAILIVCLGLTACDRVPLTPQSRIAAAKAKIAVDTANPTTIQWSDVKVGPGDAVCGVFNAQTKGGAYGAEIVWTGALHFVTIDGEPTVITNTSDCEKEVRPWSRCVNDGDEAKVAEDVKTCKSGQAEDAARDAAKVADLMVSSGLFATGDMERDQASWDAYYKAARMAATTGLEDPAERIRWAAGDKWKAEYNRIMLQLPKDATKAQKVAEASRAVAAATAVSEAYLRAHGVV